MDLNGNLGAEGLRGQVLLGDHAEGIIAAQMEKHNPFLEEQIGVVGSEGLWYNNEDIGKVRWSDHTGLWFEFYPVKVNEGLGAGEYYIF